MGTAHWSRQSECGFDCEVLRCVLAVVRRGCVKMVVVWSAQNGGCGGGLVRDSHERLGKEAWAWCFRANSTMRMCAPHTPALANANDAQFAPLSPFLSKSLRTGQKKMTVRCQFCPSGAPSPDFFSRRSQKHKRQISALASLWRRWGAQGATKAEMTSQRLGWHRPEPASVGTLVPGAWTRMLVALWVPSFFPFYSPCYDFLCRLLANKPVLLRLNKNIHLPPQAIKKQNLK